MLHFYTLRCFSHSNTIIGINILEQYIASIDKATMSWCLVGTCLVQQKNLLNSFIISTIKSLRKLPEGYFQSLTRNFLQSG